jgi:hypothetical protein
MPSPETQAEALVVLTWSQNCYLFDSVRKLQCIAAAFLILNRECTGDGRQERRYQTNHR